MITINSQLDMTPGAIPAVIHRSQYDSDFSIVFTLFARTGDFTIASGTTAKVRGTKKSGTGYSADATIDVSAKTVTVTGDQQMTVASGQNIFEIVLMSGTKELCSANFVLNVERAAMDMDTITDDTVARELDNLDQFVTEAETAADRAEAAAESVGRPTDEQAQAAVNTWLNAHPEATTTVQDGSLTEAKFTDTLKLSAIKDYVTPQMFGAKADGTTDDSTAIQEALNVGKYIVFPAGTYKISSTVYLGKDARKQNFVIDASAAIIQYAGSGNAIDITNIRNCRIYFGTIQAASGTCVYMHSTDSTQSVQYVDFSFKNFVALNDCINIYQNGGGWVNEVRFRDGQFKEGVNGVYISENADAWAMDGLHFEDLGIEGVTNGFNLNGNSKGIQGCYWAGCRYQESFTNLFVTTGLVYNCVFTGAHTLKEGRYSFSESTNNFLFVCPIQQGSYPALITVILAGQAFPFDSLHRTLGGGINVPENSDFNTYITPGNYIVPSYSIAGTISNIPEKRNGKLTVEYFGNFYSANYRYFKQVFSTYNGYAYERTCEYVAETDTATFTDWEKIYTSKNDGTSTCILGTKVSQKVNQVRRIGNVVMLSLRLTATEENSSTDVLATIPEGYRPANGINAMAHRTSINNNFKNTMIYVGSNGVINLFGGSAKFTNDADGDLVVELTYLTV